MLRDIRRDEIVLPERRWPYLATRAPVPPSQPPPPSNPMQYGMVRSLGSNLYHPPQGRIVSLHALPRF